MRFHALRSEAVRRVSASLKVGNNYRYLLPLPRFPLLSVRPIRQPSILIFQQVTGISHRQNWDVALHIKVGLVIPHIQVGGRQLCEGGPQSMAQLRGCRNEAYVIEVGYV